HLNGRIVDLRQSRNRQLPIGHEAHQQNPHHQQGGGDRPQNKRPGYAHCGFPVEWPCCGASVRRRAPLCGLLGCAGVGAGVASAFCGFGGAAGAVVVLTLLPSCSLSCPSTTTTSPGFNPALSPTELAVVCARVTV